MGRTLTASTTSVSGEEEAGGRRGGGRTEQRGGEEGGEDGGTVCSLSPSLLVCSPASSSQTTLHVPQPLVPGV